MKGTLARLASWGRRALVLGALVAAPVLATAPAAEARVTPAVLLHQGAPERAVPVQYYGPPGRHYRGRGHFRGPPPRPYYGRPYVRRGYGPPRGYYGPPRRFAGPPAYRYR